jgi:Fe-S cluster biogenesis protein NfuA
MDDLYERVDKALDEIRPYIHSHAGEVNIVDITNDGKVKIQMVGTCHGCPMSMLTLRLGIERILMEKVEGITGVISVRPDDFDFDEIQPAADAAI